MKKYITINVKQKHIDAGTPGNANTCAIAQALIEQFGTKGIEVGVDEIKVEKSNGFSFELTWNDIAKKVQNFIEKFDDGRTVKPFKFRLPFIS